MNTLKRQKTLSEWVNLYADGLYSRAMYMLNDKMLAQDMVQDTYAAALKGLDGFKEESEPKTWLMSILNRKIIDHYRKVKSQRNRGLTVQELPEYQMTQQLFDDSDSWKGGSEESFWSNDKSLFNDDQFIQIFNACIWDLPDIWRKSIQAKYILQKKAKEICQELDITTSNYWQIVHRSKLVLRECLNNKWFNQS